MEFDTNFIKLPKPFEYVVYDCFARVFVSNSNIAAFLISKQTNPNLQEDILQYKQYCQYIH